MKKSIRSGASYQSSIFILLVFSFPVKVISLIALPLWILYQIKTSRLNVYIFACLVMVFSANLIVSMITNGVLYLFNWALFVLFISPILLFVSTKPINVERALGRSCEIKLVIEDYIWVQILFCFVAALLTIASTGDLDVAFGDAIAGTFRNPFSMKSDSSNLLFVFMMLLILPIYYFRYKNESNMSLIAIASLCIFLASVNHLILAAIIASAISITFIAFKSLIKAVPIGIIIFSILIYLYKLIQPLNYSMVVDYIFTIMDMFSNSTILINDWLKFEFVKRFWLDFNENFFQMITFGVGGGTYSSRTALFFTGEYIDGFKFVNVSSFMENNTLPLWHELLSAPPWKAGAFFYPYMSNISFIAEIGLIPFVLFFIAFVRRLNSAIFLSKSNVIYLSIFIFIAGFVDNYYEYYQVFAILISLVLLIERSYISTRCM